MADGKVVIDSKFNKDPAERGFDQLQNKMEKASGKAKKVGQNMTKFITAPVMGAAAAAGMAGMRFEESMSQVQAVTGATGDSLEKLEDQAKELGSTTKFSASEAADAMGFLGMAGYDTNQIMESMPGLLDLAAAGKLDLARAADIASNVMSGFNLEAEDTGKISDILAKSAATANTSVEQMGGAMSYVGPVASSVGFSIEETAASIGILSDAGIQGERAGTALRGMISSLQSPVGETAKVLEELGLSAEDVNPTMNSMSEILATLEAAGMKSSDAMRLVGVEAGPALSAMMSEGSEGLVEYTGDLEDSEGAANKMAKTLSDNLKGSFKELMSALEGVAITVSEKVLPYVRKGIEIFTQLVRKFQDLSPTAQNVILVIIGIVAAIGPILAVLPGVVAAFVAVKAAIAALAGPVGIAILIIGALVAAGIWLYKNWDMVKQKFFEIVNQFQPVIDLFKRSFQTLLSSIGPIWESLKSLFETIKPILIGIGIVIGGVLVTAFGIAISVFNAAISAIGPLINAFVNLADFIGNAIMLIVSLISLDFAQAMEYFKQMNENAKQVFISLWNAIKNFVVTLVQTIIEFFKNLYMTLVGNSIIPDMVEAIKSWFNKMKNWLINIVKTLKSKVINFFSNLWTKVKSIAKNMVNGLRQKFNNIKSNAIKIWNTIKSKVSEVAGNILSTIKQKFTQIVNSVKQKMRNVKTKITNIWNEAKSFLEGIDLFQIGKDIIQGLINGIGSMAGSLWTKAQELAGSAKDAIMERLGINSPAKELIPVGEGTGEGMEVGIDHKIPDIIKQAKKLGQAAIPDVNPMSITRTLNGITTGEVNHKINKGKEKKEKQPVNLIVDRRILATMLVDDISELQGDNIIDHSVLKGNKNK